MTTLPRTEHGTLPCVGIERALLDKTDLLSNYELTTYLALRRFAGRKNECWPSVNRLCKEARCSRATVMRALKTLRKLGFIQRNGCKRYGQKGGPTVWRMLPVDQILEPTQDANILHTTERQIEPVFEEKSTDEQQGDASEIPVEIEPELEGQTEGKSRQEECSNGGDMLDLEITFKAHLDGPSEPVTTPDSAILLVSHRDGLLVSHRDGLLVSHRDTEVLASKEVFQDLRKRDKSQERACAREDENQDDLSLSEKISEYGNGEKEGLVIQGDKMGREMEPGHQCLFYSVGFPCIHQQDALCVIAPIWGFKPSPTPQLHAFVHNHTVEDVCSVAEFYKATEPGYKLRVKFAFGQDGDDNVHLAEKWHRSNDESEKKGAVITQSPEHKIGIMLVERAVCAGYTPEKLFHYIYGRDAQTEAELEALLEACKHPDAPSIYTEWLRMCGVRIQYMMDNPGECRKLSAPELYEYCYDKDRSEATREALDLLIAQTNWIALRHMDKYSIHER
jgi:predicted transcriptional regulator